MKESRSTIKTQGTWVEMGSGITPGGVQSGLQFPWKLHFLLEEVEKRGQTAIVSWLPDGMSFKVHQKEQFARDVMPEFFNTTAYKSFQRNLNLWGFKTVPKGPNKGRCSHRWLIRNKPELCQYMKRTTGKKSDSSQSQDDNPSSGDSQRGSSVAGASSNRTSSTSQQSPPLIQGVQSGMGLFLSNEQRRLVQEASPLLAQFLANIGKGDLAAANMILTPASGEDKTASTDNTTTVTAIDQQKNKKTANEAGCGSYMQEQSRMARCPARGMPPDHNTQTAHFMICQKTSHGSALSCSQAGCRQAGIKFLYCLHCGIPVAKKTFWKRHNHDEQPAQLKDTPIENGEHHSSQHIPVANVPMDDGARKRETNKRTVPSTGQESAPVKRARTCYHQPSHDSRKGVSASPENSSFEHSSRSSRPDRSSERADVSRNLSSHPRSQIGSITEREEEWVVLLRSRPTPDDSPEFLDWVTRVLRTSSNKKNSAGSDSSGESTLSNSQPGLSSMDEQSSSSQEENQSNSFSSATGTSESGGSSTDDSSSTTSNERKRRVQVFSSSSSDEGSSSEDLPSSSNERIGNRVTDSSGEDSRQKVAGN